VSQYDERGLGRSRAGKSPLADFDAFRARRVAEQEADGYEVTAPVFGYAPDYEIPFPDNSYENEPTRLVGGYPPAPRPEAEPTGRGKLRSTVVLVGMVIFVVGLGAGVYAATRPSGGTQAAGAAAPRTTPSAMMSASMNAGGAATMDPSMNTDPNAGLGMGTGSSPSADPNMGSGMGMAPATGDPSAMASQTTKPGGRGTLTMLSVVDVGGNAFTAITTRGAEVTVQVNNETQFGTQAAPFSPSEVVPGAVVMARLRRDTNGDLVATLIYSGAGDTAGQVLSASPSATDDGNGDSQGNGSGN
jgi:hypothetical protein